MRILSLQADALEIEASAKRRLADEYDAAQERGDVATRADGPSVRDHVPGENKIATAADIGLSRKDIHEARIIRDAELARLIGKDDPTSADVDQIGKLMGDP